MDRIILYTKNRVAQFQWPRRQKLLPYPKHHRFMYTSAYEDRIERKRDEILLLAVQTEKEMINLRHKASTEGVDEQTIQELEDLVANIGNHLSERLMHVGAHTEYADKDKTFRDDLKDLGHDFRESLTKPIKETVNRVKEDVNPIRETIRERAKDIKEGVTEDLKKFVNITTSSDPEHSRIERVKDFIEYNVIKGKTYEDRLKGKYNEFGGIGATKVQERGEEMTEGKVKTREEEPKSTARQETKGKQQTSTKRDPLDYGNDVQSMKDDIEAHAIDKKEEFYAQHDKKKGRGGLQEAAHEPHVTKLQGNKDLLSKDYYELHGEEAYEWAVEKAKLKKESIEEGGYAPHDTRENIQATVRDVAEGIKEKVKGLTHPGKKASDIAEGVKEKAKEAKDYIQESVGEETERKIKGHGVDVKENIQELGKSVKEKAKGVMPSMENVREVSKDELGQISSDIKEKVKGTAESVKSKGEEAGGNILNKVEHAILGEKADEINQKVSHGAHVVKEKLEEGTKKVTSRIKESFAGAKKRHEEELRKREEEKRKGPYSKDFREEEFINEPSADVIEGAANIVKDTAYATKDKLEEGYEYVKEKAKQVDTEDIKKGAQQVKEKVKEGYEYVKDKAEQTDTQDIKKGAQKVKGKAKEKYEDVKGSVKEGYEDVKSNVKSKGAVEGVKEEGKKAKNKMEEKYENIKESKDKKE